MMKANRCALTLKFDGQRTPILRRVEFLHPSAEQPTITPSSDPNAHARLNWAPGIIALSVCFIEYKIWGLAKTNTAVAFIGEPGQNPAASLGDALLNPTWIKDIFSDPARNNPVLRSIFHGHNVGGRNKMKRRIIEIYEDFLPPDAVAIWWDGKTVGQAGLKTLSAEVRKQWEPHHTLKRSSKEPSSPCKDGAKPKVKPSPAESEGPQEQVKPLPGTVASSTPAPPPSPAPAEATNSNAVVAPPRSALTAQPKPPEEETASTSEQVQSLVLPAAVPTARESQPSRVTSNRSPGRARKDSILPFALVSPQLGFFRKRDKDPQFVLRPTYREVFRREIPELTSFRKASRTLEMHRSVILRGQRASGKTTLALQIAAHLSRKGYTSLYLDVRDVNSEDLANRAMDVVTSLSLGTYLFIIDNLHAATPWAAKMYAAWKSSLGQSRLLLIALWAPPDVMETEIDYLDGKPEVIDVIANCVDFKKVYIFSQRRLNPAAKIPPLDDAAHVFLGASLRKLQEILRDAKTRLPVRAYPGQGLDIAFKKPTLQKYINLIPSLGDHLELDPLGSACFFRSMAKLCEMLAFHYRVDVQSESILSVFCNLSGRSAARWKLLIDRFDDVFRFLKMAMVCWPSIYLSYCKRLECDREFSSRMALRTIDPHNGSSVDYILWALLYLPQQHIADIAECLYGMGPAYIADRLLNITECAKLSGILHFVAHWFPKVYTLALHKN